MISYRDDIICQGGFIFIQFSLCCFPELPSRLRNRMLLRILAIYQVLGSHSELHDSEVQLATREINSAGYPINDENSDSTPDDFTESSTKEKKKVMNTRPYARFGEEHRNIVNEIFSSSAEWKTQIDLYELASGAFIKAGLPLMSMGSFERNLRIILNRKSSMEEFSKPRIYTPRHMRMLEELILDNPLMQRDKVFALINDRFRSVGLNEIAYGSFKVRVAHIRRKNNLPDNRRHANRV